MAIRNSINSNVGWVVAELNGGQRITVEAARGGRFTCQNKGFQIGDVVCYLFDPVTKSITSLLPKKVADAEAMIAKDHALQLAIESGVRDGDENNVGKRGEGREVEIPFDPGCGVVGGADEIPFDWFLEVESNPDSYRSGDQDLLEDERVWPNDIPV